MTRATLEQALAFRWRRQELAERRPARDAVAVARRLCGLHAQLLSSAQLQLAARLEDVPPGHVEALLWGERTLVKTWAMRGTLHLLPAAEYGLWRAALGTYAHYRKGAWLRAFGFAGEEELDCFVAAIGRALAGAEPTRRELCAAVERLTGSGDLAERARDSFGATLKPAAFQGLLCFAPGEGREVRFTHPERLIGAVPGPAPQEALREVTRRYLAVYGPARAEDLARWWGVTPAAGKRMLRAVEDELAAVEVDGTPAWLLAGDLGALSEPPAASSLRLLPGFDPLVVGVSRDALSPVPERLRPAVHRPQGWISPVVARSGRVLGTWESSDGRGGMTVTARLARGAARRSDREGIEAEAARLAGARAAPLARVLHEEA